jgi:hypothetical protein
MKQLSSVDRLKKGYGSVIRQVLYSILIEIYIAVKLVLIEMCLNRAYLFDAFPIPNVFKHYHSVLK